MANGCGYDRFSTGKDEYLLLMRIVATGGSGFIGGHLVQRLLSQGHHVLNIDKLTYAARRGGLSLDAEAAERYQFSKEDICDSLAMKECIFGFRPDVIVNLAAESHVDRSIEDPSLFLRANIFGACVMFQVALDFWASKQFVNLYPGFPKFIQISTDEVFGSLNEGEAPFREDSRFNPSSPYSASKASADLLALAWHKTYGLPVIVTHCSNNFGPSQFPEKLIPGVITKALRGESIPIYGDGRNIRDWIFVDNHISYLLEIIANAKAGESYNIGGENEIRNTKVVEDICNILDRLRPRADGGSHADQIIFVKDRAGHDLRYAIGMTSIQKNLKCDFVTDWNEELEKTVIWYIENIEQMECSPLVGGGGVDLL